MSKKDTPQKFEDIYPTLNSSHQAQIEALIKNLSLSQERDKPGQSQGRVAGVPGPER